MSTSTKCSDCGAGVDPLELFPRNRCINCHAKAPETIRELRNMTGESLARMWGAK